MDAAPGAPSGDAVLGSAPCEFRLGTGAPARAGLGGPRAARGGGAFAERRYFFGFGFGLGSGGSGFLDPTMSPLTPSIAFNQVPFLPAL